MSDESNVPDNAILHAPEFLLQMDERHRVMFMGFLNQQTIYELLKGNDGQSNSLYASICCDDDYISCQPNESVSRLGIRTYKPNAKIVWQALRNLLNECCIHVELPRYEEDQLTDADDALENSSPEYLSHINHAIIARRLQDALEEANGNGTQILSDMLNRQRERVRKIMKTFGSDRDPLGEEILDLLTIQPDEVINHEGGWFNSYRVDSIVLADNHVPSSVIKHYFDRYELDKADDIQFKRYRVLRVTVYPAASQEDHFYRWYDFMDGTFISQSLESDTFTIEEQRGS